MSEAKFTPGPWEIHHNGSYYDIGINDGTSVLSPVFPTVCIGVMTDQKANAHLISAAPDLYELLAAADMLIIWESMGFTNEFADRVEAALAKARGESC